MRVETDLHALDAVNVEVCVVGSGPVGACLALDLAERGISVVVLESGSARPDPVRQSLSDAVIENPRFHEPMSIATCRTLGGTSQLWGGRCTELEPIDFEDREYVANGGWPFEYDQLKRFYSRAARLLGAGDGSFGEDASESGPLRSSQVEIWANETRIQERLKAFGQFNRIRFVLNATVVDFEINEQARQISGLIVANDRQRVSFRGAKTYVLAMGGVETARLLLNVQARKPALFGGPNGALGRFYMGHLSGAIADITFASPESAQLFRFEDRENSASRRRITLSAEIQRKNRLPNVAFWPSNPSLGDSEHRNGFLSAGYLLLRSGMMHSTVLPDAILRSELEGSSTVLDHVKNCFSDLPGLISGAGDFLWQRTLKRRRIPRWFQVNRSGTYPLHYHGEHWPSRDNCIRLAGTADKVGMRHALINFSYSERDVDAIYRAHVVLDNALRSRDWASLDWRVPRDEVLGSRRACSPDGLHQIGTARMGRHASGAVVDPNCRAFDFENLFLAGSSVFPTSGQANPTFPAVALALRLANHLEALLRHTPPAFTTKRETNALRVLHVISSIDAASGGPARAVFDLALAARTRGHDVTICTTDYGGPSIEYAAYLQAGIRLHIFGSTGPKMFQRSRHLDSYLRANIRSFDIVHVHSVYLYHDWYVYRCAKKYGVPYILRPHGTFDPVVRNRKRQAKWVLDLAFQKRVNNAAAGIHYTSQEEQAVSNCSNRTSWVVPLPIRPEEFDGQAWDEKFLEKYGIAPEFVLFLGRLAWKKGADLLVRAYSEFVRSFPDVDLVIAGPDHGEEQDLRRLVSDLGMGPRVHFVGMLDGPSRVAAYKLAKAFALPSRGENFGRTAAEAMLVGTPIVMTDCVGIWEDISAADAAIVVKPEVASLRDGLIDVWSSYERAQERAVKARKLVEERYSIDAVGEALDIMYRNALANTGQGS